MYICIRMLETGLRSGITAKLLTYSSISLFTQGHSSFSPTFVLLLIFMKSRHLVLSMVPMMLGSVLLLILFVSCGLVAATLKL